MMTCVSLINTCRIVGTSRSTWCSRCPWTIWRYRTARHHGTDRCYRRSRLHWYDMLVCMLCIQHACSMAQQTSSKINTGYLS